MVKIKISYETQDERRQVMNRLEPVLRNAKVKENYNMGKYNHIYIQYQLQRLEK